MNIMGKYFYPFREEEEVQIKKIQEKSRVLKIQRLKKIKTLSFLSLKVDIHVSD